MKNFFRNHRIVKNSLFIFLALALMAGGTYVGAQFTSQGTAGGRITAGTLDLTVNGVTNAPFKIEKMVPGETKTFEWTLRNNGDTNGKIASVGVTASQSDGAWTPAEGAVDTTDYGDLSGMLEVQAFVNGVSQGAPRALPGFTGNSYSGGSFPWDLSIPAGGTVTLAIQVHWSDHGADDNKAQGDTLDGNLAFNFVQA
jgi:hypothetical protein